MKIIQGFRAGAAGVIGGSGVLPMAILWPGQLLFAQSSIAGNTDAAGQGRGHVADEETQWTSCYRPFTLLWPCLFGVSPSFDTIWGSGAAAARVATAWRRSRTPMPTNCRSLGRRWVIGVARGRRVGTPATGADPCRRPESWPCTVSLRSPSR